MPVPDEPTWSMAVAGLDDAQRDEVEQHLRIMQFDRGACLVEDGRSCPYVFVLSRGRVKSFFTDAGAREHISRVMGPGTVIGIVAGLNDTPSTLTVRALDHVVAPAILRADFMACMARVPQFASNVAKLLAALYHQKIIASKAASGSAAIRLGKALCDLAALPGLGRAESAIAIQGVTHQDLAALVGASRSWITQMLSAYEERGLVSCGRSAIQIQNLVSLAAYVRELERETA